MTLLHLAGRNVIRQGRRSFLLGGAAAFGVLVMALSGALVSGFSEAAVDNLSLGLGGHLRVSGFTASSTGRWQGRMERPSETQLQVLFEGLPGVAAVSAQASVPASIVFGTREARVPFLGVEAGGETFFRRGLVLTAGSWEAWKSSRGLILDSDTVNRLALGIGDQVLVRMVTVSGQQNLVEYNLAGVFDTLSAGGRAGAVVAFADLASDLNLGPNSTPSLSVVLADAGRAPEIAQALIGRLGGLAARTQVTTVQDAMGQLTTILSTLRWLSLAVFLVMLALVAGGVANTFRMVLLERVREIGTLRCLGLQQTGVLQLFLAEAALVTALGGLAGAVLSLGVGSVLESLPSDWLAAAGSVLRRGRLPVTPDWGAWWGALGAVTLVGTVASWGPARRAAALRPAEALATP